MKKEEILEASKKENKKKDVYEMEIELKGASIASICIISLACIYYIYEIITGKGRNDALYSIITLYNAILFTFKGIKFEKNKKLNIFTGIIWGLLTITLILSYFKVI